MNIHKLSGLDWKKVCRVNSTYFGNYWYYSNIDRDIMFSDHRSWVYAITVNDEIVKIGETEKPLGIEGKYTYDDFEEIQPQVGTKSRLGRYRKNGETDLIIRESLRCDIKEKIIEIYAYKCPENEIEISITDKKISVKSQIHKQLEKTILDIIAEKDGCYPWLNTGRC